MGLPLLYDHGRGEEVCSGPEQTQRVFPHGEGDLWTTGYLPGRREWTHSVTTLNALNRVIVSLKFGTPPFPSYSVFFVPCYRKVE